MALDNPPHASLETQAVNFHTAVPDAVFRIYLDSIYSIDTVTDLINKTGTLDVSARGLVDIRGVEYCANITNLHVQGNNLDSLPVTELVNLVELRAGGGNNLTSANVEFLVNLDLLQLGGNQIAQSELEDIVDGLYANRVALGGNSCSIELQGNPGSAATAISKSVEIIAIELEGCTVVI